MKKDKEPLPDLDPNEGWRIKRIPPPPKSDQGDEPAPEPDAAAEAREAGTEVDDAGPERPGPNEERTIGIADTTFARMDMGGAAARAIRASEHGHRIEIVRVTVPGFKDLGVAAKKLVEEHGCDIVLACGQAGPEEIDKQCAHEASLGIQWAQLMTSTHILEVFVHTDEVGPDDEATLKWLGENRAREHALNAVWMLFEPDTMRSLAGTGQREGFEDEGAIE